MGFEIITLLMLLAPFEILNYSMNHQLCLLFILLLELPTFTFLESHLDIQLKRA